MVRSCRPESGVSFANDRVRVHCDILYSLHLFSVYHWRVSFQFVRHCFPPLLPGTELSPSEDVSLLTHGGRVSTVSVLPACFCGVRCIPSLWSTTHARSLTDAPRPHTRTPLVVCPSNWRCHQKAAMLRPATTTERAVASVLNDVSAAIHGAEQDLIINERQARTLLSRIRRSARLPE